MAADWTTSGIDLHLVLPDGTGRRAALERALRDAITSGRLTQGARLPATRALAADLGLARGTVVEAYEQLAVEGYIVTRHGAPARVGRAPVAFAPAHGTPGSDGERPRFDLRPGVPDVAAFPRDAWLRAMRAALRDTPDAVLAGGDPSGEPRLRAALAAQLGRARGVVSAPDRILVCSGFSHGLALLCRTLRGRGARRIALEDPGIPGHREIASEAGLEIVLTGVDEQGARPPSERADAILVTPAHQFPLGVTMSAARRADLLDWARAADALVIEDDYDGEFRYDRNPVGALQGLDPARVAYAGTASKALAPGLRLGWLVLPPEFAGPVAVARSRDHGHVPILDQMALADLLDSGALDRQIRRMRARYRRRRDALVALLADRAPDLRAAGIAGGLHAVVDLGGRDPAGVHERARQRGLALALLEDFTHHADPGGRGPALVVGYGTPPEHAFSGALGALGDVLEA